MAASVLTLAAIVYYLYDPMESRLMPQCMAYKLTGWKCPACGVQRALHAALHGHFVHAAKQNLFLLVSLPYFAGVCYGSVKELPMSGYMSKIFCSRAAMMAYVAAFLSWWVIRNVAGI